MAPRDISSTEPYQRDNPLHFLMCALLQCPQAYVQTSVGTGHGLAACWPSHRPCKGLINDYQNRLMGQQHESHRTCCRGAPLYQHLSSKW